MQRFSCNLLNRIKIFRSPGGRCLIRQPARDWFHPCAQEQGGQSLGQAAEDPTASLMSLQIADWYTASFHKLDGEDANTVVLRPVIPFRTGCLNHILRATIPSITDSPARVTGLSDITLLTSLFSTSNGGDGASARSC